MVNRTLPDPVITLYDAKGQVIEVNDSWRNSPGAARVANYGLAPKNPRESAIFARLAAGNYTVICKDAGGKTGIALVEVYAMEP